MWFRYICLMEIIPFDDTYFMKQALLQAKEAFEKDEVPVGAVIVCIVKRNNFHKANIPKPHFVL